MRLSELFFTTLRDAPNELEMPSARLLQRAGYVRQLGSGILRSSVGSRHPASPS